MSKQVVFNSEAVAICYCRDAFKTPTWDPVPAHIHLSDLRQALDNSDVQHTSVQKMEED